MTPIAESDQPFDALVAGRGDVGRHRRSIASGISILTDMDLVRLGTYNSVTEANVVKARLESEGIEALVQADDLGSTTPFLGAIRGVRVLVREEDRALAMELLERMLPPGANHPIGS